jgi:hypothetical protein
VTASSERPTSSRRRSSASSAGPSWRAGDTVPDELTAVRWADGTIECRFRIVHPAGSLVADDGEVGVVLTDDGVDCTTCSSACSS